jgi:hypothetical protein
MIIQKTDNGANELIAEAKKICNLRGYGGGNAIHTFISYFKEDQIIVALGIGKVYGDDINRADQWKFGENRKRRLWIDYIWSSKKGYGRKVISELEEHLVMFSNDIPRKNVYVMSIPSSFGFYHACGYTPISTEDHEDDEDYPSSFTHGSCVGYWFCKPLGDKIDDEKEMWVPPYCIVQHKMKWMYPSLFTSPTPSIKDITRFIEEYSDEDLWCDEMRKLLVEDAMDLFYKN